MFEPTENSMREHNPGKAYSIQGMKPSSSEGLLQQATLAFSPPRPLPDLGQKDQGAHQDFLCTRCAAAFPTLNPLETCSPERGGLIWPSKAFFPQAGQRSKESARGDQGLRAVAQTAQIKHLGASSVKRNIFPVNTDPPKGGELREATLTCAQPRPSQS